MPKLVMMLSMSEAQSDGVGGRLRRARQEAKLSQRELGRRTGLTGRYIGQLEAGDRDGTRDVWRKIAQELGTDFAELLAGEPSGDHGPGSFGIPLDGRIEANGEAIGQRLTREVRPVLHRAAKDAFTYPNRINVPGAKESWWAMTVNANLVRAGIRTGDRLVFAPGLQPREGDWVLVTSDTAAYRQLFAADVHEPWMGLRLWRTIDGERWLWPLAEGESAEPWEDYWRVVAVVVQHWRRPDAWES